MYSGAVSGSAEVSLSRAMPTGSSCAMASLSTGPGDRLKSDRSLAALDVGRSVEAADHGPLVVAEVPGPHIDDEDRAVAGAAVPGFVLDRVVEGECMALDPAARLAADAELAAVGDDQRQVDDAAHVGHPGVRRDVAAGLQDREEDVGRAAGDVADRERF